MEVVLEIPTTNHHKHLVLKSRVSIARVAKSACLKDVCMLAHSRALGPYVHQRELRKPASRQRSWKHAARASVHGETLNVGSYHKTIYRNYREPRETMMVLAFEDSRGLIGLQGPGAAIHGVTSKITMVRCTVGTLRSLLFTSPGGLDFQVPLCYLRSGPRSPSLV